MKPPALRPDPALERALSQELQDIARELDALLQRHVGQRVLFSLLLWPAGSVQYVSNAERADVMRAMESVLGRWKAGQPDVPYHLKQ